MAAEVAKLYADALYELFTEAGSDDKIHDQLNEFADVFRANPELTKLLAAPLLTSEEKISVVSKIFDDNGLVYDFLCLLCEKGRAAYFTEITEEFNRKYNEFKNIVDVTVTTSIPLTEELRGKLTDKLEKKLGKTVILREKTDESIIDGIIIDYNNKRIDNSVRFGLETLRHRAADADI
ncbi:ATP synthase F1 subunit delta [Ruminococcus sp. HUN007]|jgi:F-type H+-transporting ATPase subunit delta|uniref:ATP synthase F1 subunit delta n=1 Tax=Ruminococcus sp. HUN007 TaxID=1514668 RepID=UPI0005D1C6B0|nr:ATP synthase F1 subunit delta [Ruminococcus sp. HUN007]